MGFHSFATLHSTKKYKNRYRNSAPILGICFETTIARKNHFVDVCY